MNIGCRECSGVLALREGSEAQDSALEGRSRWAKGGVRLVVSLFPISLLCSGSVISLLILESLAKVLVTAA